MYRLARSVQCEGIVAKFNRRCKRMVKHVSKLCASHRIDDEVVVVVPKEEIVAAAVAEIKARGEARALELEVEANNKVKEEEEDVGIENLAALFDDVEVNEPVAALLNGEAVIV